MGDSLGSGVYGCYEGGGRGSDVATMVGGGWVPPPEPPNLDVYMKEGGSTKTLSQASLELSELLLKPVDSCLSTVTDSAKLPPPKP